MKVLPVVLAAVCLMIVSTAARAETTVTLADVHLCCGGCVKNASAAVAAVNGAKATCDQTERTVVITAPDKETVQAAVNALVAAGYFGTASDPSIKLDAPSGAADGKVQTLHVAGVHLCCNSCVRVVKSVLGNVNGVAGSTVVAKASTFTVTGNFDAKAVFEELHRAGLSGKVTTTPAPAPTTIPAK